MQAGCVRSSLLLPWGAGPSGPGSAPSFPPRSTVSHVSGVYSSWFPSHIITPLAPLPPPDQDTAPFNSSAWGYQGSSCRLSMDRKPLQALSVGALCMQFGLYCAPAVVPAILCLEDLLNKEERVGQEQEQGPGAPGTDGAIAIQA